jgi:hypothetical protein
MFGGIDQQERAAPSTRDVTTPKSKSAQSALLLQLIAKSILLLTEKEEWDRHLSK